jgi:hypothetical protein
MGLDMRIARTVAGVAILAAVSAGCSSTSANTEDRKGSADTSRADAHEFAHLVRSTISYDFQPSKSPNALIGKADVALLGRVMSIEEGRVQGDPNEAPTHFVVIGLAASKFFKKPAEGDQETYYFEIPRPDNYTAAEYRERLPLGTSLVLIGETAKPIYEPVQNNFAGRPEGSSLYAPAPEGLFVITSSGDFEPVFVGFNDMSPGWQGVQSLNAFEAAVKQ